jgi:hypothetical protein
VRQVYSTDHIDAELIAQQLQFLSKTSRDTQRLDQMKPTQVVTDVIARWDDKKKRVEVKQKNFQKRIRDGQRQVEFHNDPLTLVLTCRQQAHVTFDVNGHDRVVQRGRTSNAAGKTAHVITPGNHEGKNITSVVIEGRDDPTAAETKRANYILKVLQGKIEMLDDNPWIQNVWLASGPLTWPEGFFVDSPPLEPLTAESFSRSLNESQLDAVNQMLSRSKDDCINIIQGDNIIIM